jgi:DNA mismatch repair protein MutS2
MTNIAGILNNLGSNALVLCDELGAGTDPAEGSAMARSILAFLLRRGACAIATSHYGELKTFAFSQDGIQNASVEFDENSLRPTYRLLQGVPGSSNAIAIARRLGLPEEALAEARELLTGGDDDASVMIRSLETARRQAITEADEARKALNETTLLKERAQKELSEYEQLRHEVRSKALDEARAIVRKAQDKAAGIVGEIKRRAKAEGAGRAGSEAREQLRDIEQGVSEEIDTLLALPRGAEADSLCDAPVRPLKVGDLVRVPGVNLHGTLLEDPADKQKVCVQVGKLRVMAFVDGLVLLNAKPEPPPVQRRQAVAAFTEYGQAGRSTSESSVMDAASVSLQLTLIGQRADDALANLERYIDDAHAAGARRIRIVHGKGTGALRRVVHEHLKNHPYVDLFELATPDEGGAGATIAELVE